MLKIRIDQEKVKELSEKFYRNKPAQKYQIPYEELLTLASPNNPEGMKLLQQKLNVSRQMAYNFYKRWIGPVYAGLDTPGKRSKLVTKLNWQERTEPKSKDLVPERLQRVWRNAQRFKLVPKLIRTGHEICKTRLLINDRVCTVRTRNKVTTVETANYIVMHIRPNALTKTDFVILEWINQRYDPCNYILPTQSLLAEKLHDSISYSYYLPLQPAYKRLDRPAFDWSFFRDNWNLIKTAA